MGAPETPLEDKQLTVAYGADLVNISFINFSFNSKEITQLWTDSLLKMAYNLLALNAPVEKFLEKARTKVQLLTDKDGKVPVKKHKLTPHLLQEIVEYPLNLGYLQRSDPPTVAQCSAPSVIVSFGGGGAGEVFF